MKIIIIGSGGAARVVYEILRQNKNLDVVAFVSLEQGEFMGLPVVTNDNLPNAKGFIVAIGDNKIRKKRFEEYLALGLEPINAIHPTSLIADDVKIGKGVMVAPRAVIITGASIGDNIVINTGVIIEHEDIIESHANISSGTSLAGKVTVREGTFMGMGCVVVPETTIGRNVIVGAGSVVLKDIPDNVTVVGSPARVIKENPN